MEFDGFVDYAKGEELECNSFCTGRLKKFIAYCPRQLHIY